MTVGNAFISATMSISMGVQGVHSILQLVKRGVKNGGLGVCRTLVYLWLSHWTTRGVSHKCLMSTVMYPLSLPLQTFLDSFTCGLLTSERWLGDCVCLLLLLVTSELQPLSESSAYLPVVLEHVRLSIALLCLDIYMASGFLQGMSTVKVVVKP